jgi:hypothetical protein
MRFHLAALLAAFPLAVCAQELSFSAGSMRSEEPRGHGVAWSLRYARDIAGPFFASAGYVNEGHVSGHHRDGTAAQLGVRGEVAGGLVLSVAGGAYRFFDTEVAEKGPGYSNAHGWGAIYSLAAAWPARDDGWFYELRVDRVESPAKPDTTMIVAGFGYRPEQDQSFRGKEPPRLKGGRDEVVGYLGQTVVNSFESQQSTARSIEWRHSFTPVVRGSLSWLNEGDARLIRRNGIVAQAWLEPTFYHGLFSVGVGYGAYLAVDAYQPGQRHSMGLLSMTASHRLARGWDARLTWHRSVSNYDRDSDVFLLGVGFQF